MEFTKVLMWVAVVAVVVSAVNLVGMFSILPTGYAQQEDTGTADVEIIQDINIVFTEATIDWGQGAVAPAIDSATLYTEQTGGFYVIDGSWTDVAPDSEGNGDGLLLENQGNVDVVLSLVSDKNPIEFICPTQSAPDCTTESSVGVAAEFNWKLSDGPTATGACTGILSDQTYTEICKVGDVCDGGGFGRVVCTNFNQYADAPNNVLAIDLQLIIPSDAAPMGSSSQAQLTAHAEAV